LKILRFYKYPGYSRPQISRWIKLISTFLLGQTVVQVLQLLSGVLLFRWLTIEQYAQYTMAFAFQTSAHILVEFGFSGTIVALVGDKIHDKQRIGSLVKAGQYYRRRLYIGISIACVIIFPLLTYKQNWPFVTSLLLLISILTNLFFTGWTSYYTPPLRMHQKIKELYALQIKSGVLRLTVLYLLNIISVLNSWIAAMVGSIHTFVTGYLTRKAGKDYIDHKAVNDQQTRTEMLNLIKPITPIILFTAFQGQILVFLSSIFGETEGIAEIGVLSRIGQMYMVFSMAGGVLIAPYIARLPKEKLFKTYSAIIGGGLLFCLSIILFGYYVPQPFLIILGNKYEHLAPEIVLLLIASGINLMNGIIWEMNESRKWIYSFDSISVIVGTIVVQALCMYFFNLKQTSQILWLSIITNLFVFLIRMLVASYGLITNSRKTQDQKVN